MTVVLWRNWKTGDFVMTGQGIKKLGARAPLHLLLLFIVLATCGCQTTYDLLRADPVPQTSFLSAEPKLQDMPATFPFRKFWIDKSVDFKEYDSIVVTPVDRSRILDMNNWAKFNERLAFDTYRMDCETMSAYMSRSFRNAFAGEQGKRFRITSTPGERTLLLEMALIELAPTKTALNVVETIVGIFIPGVGALTMFNSGVIAIEGKISDSRTGKNLCVFADRQKARYALLDFAGFMYYKQSENAVDEWSAKLVRILMAKDKEREEIWMRSPLVLIDW